MKYPVTGIGQDRLEGVRLCPCAHPHTAPSLTASERCVNALKSFDPPLHALEGRAIRSVGRRGKLILVELDGDLSVVVHLMSAGRFQLYDRPASLRDRTSRVLLRLEDGRELRLREFGTKQRAWAKVVRSELLA